MDNTISLKSLETLVAWLARTAMLPALAATLVSWTAYREYFSHLGPGIWGDILALVVAAAVGAGYLAVCHALLRGAARLPGDRRKAITPVIVGVWAIVSLASAFPILINAGKGIATKASARSYITDVQIAGDKLKSGALAFDQIGPVVENGANTLDALRTMEIEGVYSGTRSEGAVARWIAGFVQKLRDSQSTIAPARARTRALIADIDRAVDRMRRALVDPDLNLDAQRNAMQRAGDDARSALVALKEAAPTAALKSLAASLQGEHAIPKLSDKAKIRRGQEAGIRRIMSELQRIGQDLDRRVDDLSGALKVRIPTYELPADSILVLSNWQAVPHVAAMAFGLDALPFALYLIVARLYDAQRAESTRVAAGTSGWRTSSSTQQGPSAPLGPHPHRHAARARQTDGGEESDIWTAFDDGAEE